MNAYFTRTRTTFVCPECARTGRRHLALKPPRCPRCRISMVPAHRRPESLAAAVDYFRYRFSTAASYVRFVYRPKS